MRLLIINGPNLNLVGKREPELYGNQDLATYLESLVKRFPETEITLFQSNQEGEIIDSLQRADGQYDGVILNAGGYSHTSVAIADTVAAIVTPVVEVHITNIYAREPERHISLISKYARGCIVGMGIAGYDLAVRSFIKE
jgi:3-dehydroquinate dehydratase-2